MLKPPPAYFIGTGFQCREADNRTINEFGIDGITLMEVAGTRAADFIMSNTAAGSRALIFCGKGNNAGDALVVARLLSQKAYKVTVCFAEGTDRLSAQADTNFQLLTKLEGDISIARLQGNFSKNDFDFVIDGMLGTGLNTAVKTPYTEIIDFINRADKPVFALDIPTGLHADSGNILGKAVKADYTLTFGLLKTGFYLNDGPEVCGRIILCELPFPNHLVTYSAGLIDEEWVASQIPEKQLRKHKYDRGVLYIIAGSEGLAGAAILSSRSAWAAGLGAVIVITPRAMLPVYDKNLIQIIKKPVGAQTDSFFKPGHLGEVLQIIAEKPGNVLIGPGLGRHAETLLFVQQFCAAFNGNVILDADALFALSQAENWKKPEQAAWILTPHPGEFKQLFGGGFNDDFERLQECKKQAAGKNVTILSKGYPGIVAAPVGELLVTGYDTRIFSRAGFGDVLAGKLGAYFLEYGDPALACAAALLDGKNKAEEYYNRQNENLEPLNLI